MGRLRPGQRLRVEELKVVYGVSTSTLREALLVLTGESLVQSFHQRGFWVAPASLSDLIDIFENLGIIEVEALRRAIAAGGDDWEAGIMSTYHLLTKTEERMMKSNDADLKKKWEVLHVDFHISIFSRCGSARLIRSCVQLREQALRYRHLADVPQVQHPDLTSDHLPLMEATLDRDEKAACRILSRHFDTSKRLISNQLNLAALNNQTNRALLGREAG